MEKESKIKYVQSTIVGKDGDLSSQEVLDEALRQFLFNNKETNLDIVEQFSKFFLTEHNLPFITIKTYKKLISSTFGYSNATGIFLKNNFVHTKSPKQFLNLVYILFHELEHIKTDADNNNLTFLNNSEFKKYTSYNNDKIPENLAYALYFLSSNELNSRKAEILYANKILERLKFICENEEEFFTEENWAYCDKLSKLINKANNRLNERISKLINVKINGNAKLYKLAQKAFEYIQKTDNEKKLITNKKVKKVLNNYLFILAYTTAYKNKEFYNQVFNYLINNNNSCISDSAYFFLITNPDNFSKKELDKIIISYGDDYDIKHHINALDYAKHILLFHGSEESLELEVNCDSDTITKTKKRFKNFKFNGLPYHYELTEDKKDAKFYIQINGEQKEFNSKSELMLEVSNYIDSSIMDNLNEENIEKINSIFGEEVIVDLTKENSQQNEQRRIYQKEQAKKRDEKTIFSNVYEDTF